jgi:hypothetical protein
MVINGGYAVVKPFVTVFVNIQLGTEGAGIINLFGALVYYAPVLTVKGCAIGIALNKVLIDLWPQIFHQKPQVTKHREVAHNAVLLLNQIIKPYQINSGPIKQNDQGGFPDDAPDGKQCK